MVIQPAEVDVSVLVPVLNEQAYLGTAVPAMLSQDYGGTIEVLFIDGGSTDGSLEILRGMAAEDSRIRLLANPHRRTPQALNIGLRHARGRFIVRMDAHTVYPPTYIAVGVARLERPDAGGVVWVSGPQLAVGTNRGSRRVALALSTPLGVGGARYRLAHQAEVEVDSGFTGVWQRSTLEQAGGWDEEFVNDQDFELAARIRAAGGRIVSLPEMAASYIPRDTLPRLAKQYLTYGRFRVKTAKKHPTSMRRSQLLPPALVLTAAASIIAPTPIRRAARLGIGLYAVVLAGTAARSATAGQTTDAVALPAVLATMHVSYGVGVLLGCAQFGLPAEAILGGQRAAWRMGRAQRL